MKISMLTMTVVYLLATVSDLFVVFYNPFFRDIFMVLTIGALTALVLYIYSVSSFRGMGLWKNQKLPIIYFLVLLVSQISVHNLGLGTYAVLLAYLIVGFLTYILIPYSFWKHRDLLRSYFKIVSIASGIVAFTAVWNVIGFSSFFGIPLNSKVAYNFMGISATGGILSHPLTLGTQMIFGLGTSYYLWRRTHSKLYLIPLILCGIALFLSMARGALVGLVAGVFYALLPSTMNRRALLALVIAPIMLGLVIYGFYNFAQQNAFLSSVLRLDMGLSQRDILWGYALLIILESPLWGYGFKNSPNMLAESGILDYLVLNEGAPFHNSFIDLAVDAGLLVTVIYILMFIVPIRRLLWMQGDILLKKTLLAMCVAMLIAVIFVNYNIGGLREVSINLAIFLGVANWAVLDAPKSQNRFHWLSTRATQ